MSLESILKRIMDDARSGAENIIRESRQKAEEIKKKAQIEAEELAEAMLKEAERQARLEASRLITQANLEKKLRVLSSKRELIEEVLEKAFGEGASGQKEIRRKVILKEGEKEEPFDEERLKDELRQALENEIITALGL